MRWLGLIAVAVVLTTGAAGTAGAATAPPPNVTVPPGYSATLVATLPDALSIGFDASGNLLAGTFNLGCFDNSDVLERVNPDGTTTPIVSGFTAPQAILPGPGGAWGTNTYVIDSNANACHGQLFRVDAAGVTTLADFGSLGNEPRGFAFDPSGGSLWIAEAATGLNPRPESGYIEQMLPGGTPTVVATGSPLGDPSDLAFGPGGAYGTDLYISDPGEQDAGGVPPSIERMDASGHVAVWVPGDDATALFWKFTFAPPGPFGGLLYVINQATLQLDTASPAGVLAPFATLVTTDTGQNIRDVAASPDGRSLYLLVAAAGGPYLFRIDANPPPAPALTAPVDGATITGTSVPVAGTAQPGATVEILDAGVAAATLTADSTGAFAGALTLPFGTHSLTATQTVDGLTSTPSAAVGVTVVPPPPVLVSPTDGATITGHDVSVAGTAEPGALVQVSDAGVVVAAVPADATGAFSGTLTLSFGTHSLTAVQTVDGVTSTPGAPVGVTVVPSPPVLVSPADGATFNASDVSVTGTAEPGALVQVSDAGVVVAAVPADATGAYSGTLTLADGTHSLTATQALDGVVSAPTSSHTILVDTTPPLVSCGAADGLWHADNVTIACTAVDTGSGLANAGDASFGLSTSVPLGSADANASTNSRNVCDVAGNCTTAGPIGGNMVDRAAPVLHLPADITTSNPVVSYTVTATDDDDPSPSVSCSPPSGSTFALGTTTVSCTATDHAGNTTSGSFTVTVVPSKTPLQRLSEDAAAIGNANLKAHVRNLGRVGGNGYCSQLKVIVKELAAITPQTPTVLDAEDAAAALQRAGGCSG